MPGLSRVEDASDQPGSSARRLPKGLATLSAATATLLASTALASAEIAGPALSEVLGTIRAHE